MQKKAIKVEMALIDEIGSFAKTFKVIHIVEPIKKEAEKAENAMLVESKRLADMQSKIDKAKIALKELGVENKDLTKYESILKTQSRIIGNLMSGITKAKYIDNV
jgi:hypothetical protein